MNKQLLRRIFAIIALVGIVGVTVFGTLTFFNLFDEKNSPVFGTFAVAFACVTAVFFILAYILKDKEPTSLGIPEEADGSQGEESALVTGGKAENGENEVDENGDIDEDGTDKETEAEKN
ncbi:MAG: hypothetical protein IJX05_01445 [Clostridia bacterium]|nr:hypothetical protein [Clostridia bacterium]